MTDEIVEVKTSEVKWIDLQELFLLSPEHKEEYSKYKKTDPACGCSICFLNWCMWKKIELPEKWKKYEAFMGA